MNDSGAASVTLAFPWVEPREGLALLALGFWTGLDMTAFLQILVSQPLVAGWLGGLAAGDSAVGLAVGLLLQGIWSRALPMGASPLPMAGPAALAAGALAASSVGSRTVWGPALALPGALPLALALFIGVLAASAGRPLLAKVQRERTRVLRDALRAAQAGSPRGVVRAHLMGALPSGLLGLGLTGVAMLVGGAALAWTAPLGMGDGVWVAVPVLGLGLGQIVSLTGRSRARGWTVAVLLLGALGFLIR